MLNPWCWYQQFIIFPHGAFYCSVGRFYINIAFMAISITHTVVCPLLSIFSYDGYYCSMKWILCHQVPSEIGTEFKIYFLYDWSILDFRFKLKSFQR